MFTPEIRRTVVDNIDNYLRQALNQAYVLLKNNSNREPTLDEAKKLIIEMVSRDIPDDPSAFAHQYGKFPYQQGPGGWIGEALRPMFGARRID